MYFHDLTLEKELMKELIANEFAPSYIQAEHKLGRVKISFARSFDDLDRLISFITMYFNDRGYEWRFKNMEQSEINTLIIFKEMITL